ncbi:hypothetical protein SAMN05216374_1406 [Tardiphaga sp. OK246]|jgi:hypothetical protein|nr:hypothetical protein SAMN05216374_1406 [Tardiphaga sp. OK246]
MTGEDHRSGLFYVWMPIFLLLSAGCSFAQDVESPVCRGTELNWQITIGNGAAVLQTDNANTAENRYAGAFQRVPTRSRQSALAKLLWRGTNISNGNGVFIALAATKSDYDLAACDFRGDGLSAESAIGYTAILSHEAADAKLGCCRVHINPAELLKSRVWKTQIDSPDILTASLYFESDHRLRGSTNCGGYVADVSSSPSDLQVKNLAHQLTECLTWGTAWSGRKPTSEETKEIMSYFESFFQVLQLATAWRIEVKDKPNSSEGQVLTLVLVGRSDAANIYFTAQIP